MCYACAAKHVFILLAAALQENSRCDAPLSTCATIGELSSSAYQLRSGSVGAEHLVDESRTSKWEYVPMCQEMHTFLLASMD